MRAKLSLACALLAVGTLVAADSDPKREKNTPPARGERFPERLKAGDTAPDFTLKDPKGKAEITLSDFQGKKPVILIFGSYT